MPIWCPVCRAVCWLCCTCCTTGVLIESVCKSPQPEPGSEDLSSQYSAGLQTQCELSLTLSGRHH